VAEHYTLRLADGMRERLSERARRARLPERTLAQRYVEEGLRHDAHPLIQFLDGPSGRRASLIGSGLDVWEVIATVRDNDGSAAEAAAYLQVPAGLVQATVAYYGEYRDEIDEEIQLNEAEYERGLAAATGGERALRDEFADALEREARRRALPASAIARDALSEYLGIGRAGERRELGFAAVGHSGQKTTARDMEQLLEREWSSHARRR
jgi:hypothetical protein